jgi:hypothetical protein
MNKKPLAIAALAIVASAAVLFLLDPGRLNESPHDKFVRQKRGRFLLNGKPFRFVGANVALMYRDEDRQSMPDTLREAASSGIKVIRVWAFGEGGPNDVKPIADFADWPRNHPFVSNQTNGMKKLSFISTTLSLRLLRTICTCSCA